MVIHHAILGILLAALISIIFGMLMVSFPLGAYVVFETEIGDHITHDIPAAEMAAFGMAYYEYIPQYIELGDIFMVLWTIYLMAFAVAIVGPDRDVTVAIKSVVHGTKSDHNYMLHCMIWFSILVMTSVTIVAIQEQMGLPTTPPHVGNDLVQFHLITLAPVTEEIIFRMFLVGLPVFALYAHKMSPRFLLESLWHPARHLHIQDTKRMYAIIFATGIAFGAAHVLAEDTWEMGKITQASAAGVILGYVYCRYGFVCALLIHWAVNYFTYAYGNFVAHIGEWDVLEAFEQPFFGTIEMILIVAGAISVSAMIMGRLEPGRSQAAN